MKKKLIELLACKHCKAPVKLESQTLEKEGEIIEGALKCTACDDSIIVQNGIPVFLDREEHEDHVAQSFGFEWQMHHDGGFESDTVFGRTIDDDVDYFMDAFGLKPEDMRNLLVLDAGCGSGTLTVELAKRYPECDFVGLDFNPAIYEIFKKHGRLPNLHLVRSSVFTIPFKEGAFDLSWSNGVIHHTGDTRRAFDSVTKTVKPGGKAYLWVYQRKISLLVGLRKVLMPLGLIHWNHKFLYRFCQFISIPTWIGVKVMTLLGKIPFAQKLTHVRILTRNRGFNELGLTWFDVLSPKYRDTYSKSEFEAWFVENGFVQNKQYWLPVGVCGVRMAPESGTR
jgi:SAM-dependent methyltransferase